VVTDSAGSVAVELIARDEAAAVERTSHHGSFRFENVVPGRYRVRARELGGNS